MFSARRDELACDWCGHWLRDCKCSHVEVETAQRSELDEVDLELKVCAARMSELVERRSALRAALHP